MNGLHKFVIFAAATVAAFCLIALETESDPIVVISEQKNAEYFVDEISGDNGTNPVNILVVGDILFDRYIRQVSNKKGEDFVFSCIYDFLDNFDFVVGNLEGPITDNDSVSMGTVIGSAKNYVFTFSTTSAEVLARHNIRLVNLGNNHIGNFGREGIVSTQNYLKMAGVNYFGGLGGDEPVYRNAGISFISYNEFGGQSPEKVASIIADEKIKGRRVIVYAHWGEEYVDSPRLRDVAALFAESGADVIVGSHPHIVLPQEYIGTTLVYYSLGNFIFDQYWNSEVKSGLAVSLEVSTDEISATEYPVTLESDGRTCPDY